MELIEFGELTPQRRDELQGQETDPFDVGEITVQFRGKDRHVALVDADGTAVASTGWVLGHAQVGDERFAVAGIGGVIVRPEFRGRGLGRLIVEAAVDRVRALEAPFALLFCRPDRAGLYRRLKFTRVTAEVLVKQPRGYVVMPLETMWRPLTPGATWPEGPLTLHDLPF
ncbi:MAG TPA: GNAT family N-acetyltransferase [Solirubrobacteraceae bacterium]|nr:GNAT family N-acetyltransferase [Solirubrobacteraceae bacterium]